MKKYFTKEISIAIITIVTGFILYAGLNYMKGTNVFKHTNYFYIRMSNVNELQKSGPVYADGFKVGLVHEIGFDYATHNDIIVRVNLDKKMKVPAGSYFLLKSGLTSGAYLDLMLNKYVSEYAQPGDTLDGRSPVGMMDKISENILPQLENIMPRLDSILTGIQLLVTHPALIQSFEYLNTTTSSLAKTSTELNIILRDDIKPILSNLNKVSEDFTVVSGNLKTIDIAATMKTVDEAVENIERMSKKLNDRDNSLGLLLNDSSLYHNLDSAASNASQLMLDIKLNPKKYVKLSLF
jgi:phospholipid/cholesterol/gamma-HCH transport system substrate-binding protein